MKAVQEAHDKRSKKAKTGVAAPNSKMIRAKARCLCNDKLYCSFCIVWHALSEEGKQEVKAKKVQEVEEEEKKKLKAKLAALYT